MDKLDTERTSRESYGDADYFDSATDSSGTACDPVPAPDPGAMSDEERRRIIDELFTSHFERLCGFIERRVRSRDDAQDIAQTAYLEAFRCLPRFAGRSNLSTWLYGIAMNLLRRHVSANRGYQFMSIEDSAEGLHMPDETCSLHDSFDRRVDLERVLAALGSAPEEQRETLLLVVLEGMTYEEAAVRLAIPIGTVRSRVSRLRATLREAIT